MSDIGLKTCFIALWVPFAIGIGRILLIAYRVVGLLAIRPGEGLNYPYSASF